MTQYCIPGGLQHTLAHSNLSVSIICIAISVVQQDSQAFNRVFSTVRKQTDQAADFFPSLEYEYVRRFMNYSSHSFGVFCVLFFSSLGC
jgi:hypothetical protein